jgi:hypothetical protein
LLAAQVQLLAKHTTSKGGLDAGPELVLGLGGKLEGQATTMGLLESLAVRQTIEDWYVRLQETLHKLHLHT